MDLLKETQGTQKQYDLLVTDMNYPLKKEVCQTDRQEKKLIQWLREEGIMILTIISLTRRFAREGVFGSIWDSSLRDIEEDLREVLRRLK